MRNNKADPQHKSKEEKNIHTKVGLFSCYFGILSKKTVYWYLSETEKGEISVYARGQKEFVDRLVCESLVLVL